MIHKNFTLVEVLVAMGIFMVGVAPILGVVMSLTRSYQGDLLKNRASHFASSKIEEYKSQATPPDPKSYSVAGNVAGLSFLVQSDIVATNVYKITLGVGSKGIDPPPTSPDNIMLQKFSYLHFVE